MTAPAGGRPTRLDDLLGYDELDGRARHRRPGWARLFGRFLLGLGVTTVLWEWLHHNGVGVAYPLVIAVVAVLTCVRSLLDRLSPRPLPATLRDTPPRAGPRVSAADGIRTATRRWEMRIEWTYDDLPRFAAVVQRAVADLVDERLRLRHSITLKTDPRRARELVGPQLWAFIAEPVRRPVTAQELATLVTRMEQI